MRDTASLLHISFYSQKQLQARHVDRGIYFSPSRDVRHVRGRCDEFLQKLHISRGVPFYERYRYN